MIEPEEARCTVKDDRVALVARCFDSIDECEAFIARLNCGEVVLKLVAAQ